MPPNPRSRADDTPVARGCDARSENSGDAAGEGSTGDASSAGADSSIADRDCALPLDQQLKNLRDVLVPHSDAPLRGHLPDALGLDCAVDAVGHFADGVAVNAFQAKPVFAERVFGIVGGDD